MDKRILGADMSSIALEPNWIIAQGCASHNTVGYFTLIHLIKHVVMKYTTNIENLLCYLDITELDAIL